MPGIASETLGSKSISSVTEPPTITRVSVPIETRAPTGSTNAYVVGPVLIDPAARTATLDTAVGEHTVNHIAVTHCHADHVGGVQYYASETNATVWAYRGHTDRFTEATGVEPDAVAGADTTIGPVTVLETPGHTPEHLTFSVEDVAFVGDLAVAEGSVYIGSDEGDMRVYLSTLRRLLARKFERLYPGHGPVIQHPKRTLTRLLDHRRMREQRVWEAVKTGATTCDEIVATAYDKDLEGVHDLAMDTVVAHIEKLAVEGKMSWDGRRAVASDF